MLSPLATPAATRDVLEEHGLSTKHALGQNFLVNDAILQKIVELAQLDASDDVLEVGPGIGTLTIALLKCAGRVVSVERDADLPAVLEDTLEPWADRFALISKDALELTEEEVHLALAKCAAPSEGEGHTPCSDSPRCAAELRAEHTPRPQVELEAHGEHGGHTPCSDSPRFAAELRAEHAPHAQVGLETHGVDGSSRTFPNKFVANLPYAVAATLVLDFFQKFSQLESATVMVQKEVADRMCAEPGSKNYGAYTVKLRLYAEPAGRFLVSPNNFFPPPHVDSSVLRLDRRSVYDADGTPLDDALLKATCVMADAAFASRRKTISNSFKTYFASRGNAGKAFIGCIPDLLDECGIDAKRRGETLSLDEFIALGKAYLERESNPL